MVLTRWRLLALPLASFSALLVPGAARAQSLPDVAPAIPRIDPEFNPKPVVLEGISFTLESDARIEYDDNVFALPDDTTSDAEFVFTTKAELTHRTDKLVTRFQADVALSRFANETTQNSNAAGFEAGVIWSPRSEERISLGASYDRTIEDRGDPEARRITTLGPREIDVASVFAGYRRSRGKILLDLRAEATEFDALSALDRDRDFVVYGGTAKFGLRLSGQTFATVTAFASERDFRLPISPQGINRDAVIYGGRAGLDFAPGGKFEGNISVGVFRNEPEDALLNPRTGISLQSLVIFRPRQRTALVFDAFRGDVATFRSGASGRTDTTLRATVQQEARHNLFASVSVGYRKSEFIGSGNSEDTFIANGQVEFLVNRNFSLIARLSYGTRDSDVGFEEFDRFRGGIGVKARF